MSSGFMNVTVERIYVLAQWAENKSNYEKGQSYVLFEEKRIYSLNCERIS